MMGFTRPRKPDGFGAFTPNPIRNLEMRLFETWTRLEVKNLEIFKPNDKKAWKGVIFR